MADNPDDQRSRTIHASIIQELKNAPDEELDRADREFEAGQQQQQPQFHHPHGGYNNAGYAQEQPQYHQQQLRDSLQVQSNLQPPSWTQSRSRSMQPYPQSQYEDVHSSYQPFGNGQGRRQLPLSSDRGLEYGDRQGRGPIQVNSFSSLLTDTSDVAQQERRLGLYSQSQARYGSYQPSQHNFGNGQGEGQYSLSSDRGLEYGDRQGRGPIQVNSFSSLLTDTSDVAQQERRLGLYSQSQARYGSYQPSQHNFGNGQGEGQYSLSSDRGLEYGDRQGRGPIQVNSFSSLLTGTSNVAQQEQLLGFCPQSQSRCGNYYLSQPNIGNGQGQGQHSLSSDRGLEYGDRQGRGPIQVNSFSSLLTGTSDVAQQERLLGLYSQSQARYGSYYQSQPNIRNGQGQGQHSLSSDRGLEYGNRQGRSPMQVNSLSSLLTGTSDVAQQERLLGLNPQSQSWYGSYQPSSQPNIGNGQGRGQPSLSSGMGLELVTGTSDVAQQERLLGLYSQSQAWYGSYYPSQPNIRNGQGQGQHSLSSDRGLEYGNRQGRSPMQVNSLSSLLTGTSDVAQQERLLGLNPQSQSWYGSYQPSSQPNIGNGQGRGQPSLSSGTGLELGNQQGGGSIQVNSFSSVLTSQSDVAQLEQPPDPAAEAAAEARGNRHTRMAIRARKLIQKHGKHRKPGT